jgi:uncharacterized protein (DUF924 family)
MLTCLQANRKKVARHRAPSAIRKGWDGNNNQERVFFYPLFFRCATNVVYNTTSNNKYTTRFVISAVTQRSLIKTVYFFISIYSKAVCMN